ncbi:MAG: response regulator [Bdellovibrionales bacterium]|nr:response regulator [Bdellovibrionales bacterium]
MANSAKAPCQTILVVEDDASIRMTLRLALEMEGYTVCTASHGQEALTQLSQMSAPCLILLDLMMPIMNGWEFIKALRANAHFAPIPVALVTAYSEEAAHFEGSQALVKKPIDLEILLQVVRRFCG